MTQTAFNEWSGSVVISVPASGTVELKPSILAGNDKAFDANGDNRFTQADVTWLQQRIGQSATGALSRWDYNQSGSIDQSDVDRLQGFLNSGLGSGAFGDGNSDGVVDCRDLALLRAQLPLKRMGEVGYAISLDSNLDGALDSTDEAAMRAVYVPFPGDTNDDLVVNFADLNAVQSAYGSCVGQPNWNARADVNRDGCVNFSDLSILLANYGLSCQ